jgi:hypothetical protein
MTMRDIYEEILDLDPEIAKSWMIEPNVRAVMKGGDSTTSGDDPVNHPSHYTQGGIECIDAIKASMSDLEFQGYLKGNAIKYLWRFRQKGKPVQDLRKACWYLDRLMSELSE